MTHPTPPQLNLILGQVAEWFKALDSKSQNADFQRFAFAFRALQVVDFQDDPVCKLGRSLSRFCQLFGPKCINTVYKIWVDQRHSKNRRVSPRPMCEIRPAPLDFYYHFG